MLYYRLPLLLLLLDGKCVYGWLPLQLPLSRRLATTLSATTPHYFATAKNWDAESPEAPYRLASVPVWIYQGDAIIGDDESKENETNISPTWKRIEYNGDCSNDDGHDSTTSTAAAAAAMTAVRHTWNWCQDFVRPLDLCPWTQTSLDAHGAIQFFVVVSKNQGTDTALEGPDGFEIMHGIAKRFVNNVVHGDDHPSTMERAAIFFAVFVSSQPDPSPPLDDFGTFYEWFTELEDGGAYSESIYDDYPQVIIAPFHPKWEFANESNPAIFYEKRSPYPTISIVSARVVDQAGEAVTDKIGVHNEHVLTSYDNIEGLWQSAVFGSGDQNEK